MMPIFYTDAVNFLPIVAYALFSFGVIDFILGLEYHKPGHRVYRTYDPRMAIFKSMAIELSTSDEDRQTLEIAEKLEKMGVERFSPKHIFPNTDFYSGVAFKGIGFPLHMFTALFALSRTVGWIAHMSEYVENGGRIMRPRANYTGPDARVLQPVSHK